MRLAERIGRPFDAGTIRLIRQLAPWSLVDAVGTLLDEVADWLSTTPSPAAVGDER